MKRERTESAGAAPEIEAAADQTTTYGEKAGYRKITTTVPQWAYQLLIQESARRKIAGEPNQLLSALMREAVTDYLHKLRAQPA